MRHMAKHHFPWFSSWKAERFFIAFSPSSFPSHPSYHQPQKRLWNSYLSLKSIKWTPFLLTSGSVSNDRIHHLLTEIPHFTVILSHKSMDFIKKPFKPRE